MRRKLLFWTAMLWGTLGMNAPDGHLFHGFSALSAALWVAWWLRGRDRLGAAGAPGNKSSEKAPKASSGRQ